MFPAGKFALVLGVLVIGCSSLDLLNYDYPNWPPRRQEDPNVILVPRYGLVRGNIAYKSVAGRPISAWLGLKYGVTGTGLRRFQPADPYVNGGDEPYDATREGRNCPQFPDLADIRVSESAYEAIDDCLTLNIHAPTRAGSYPVMVFVHGEMLFDGSAEEGQPDYFMEHDVVLVSVNYRLAPFGFLSTMTDEMPGNVALDDLKLALEWVQQHIRHFNGDPDHVTFFGQAGGATLVHALAISDKAQGLFHKVILQSGTALNPYFIDEDPLSTVRTFARWARCNQNDLHRCFEHMSTSELLTVFKRIWDENESRGMRFTGGFKLIVGDRLGYLPEHPSALVANNKYPLIAGVAKDAGAFIMSRFYSELQQIPFGRNLTDYINVVLKHTSQPKHYQHWAHVAVNHIFSEQDRRQPWLNSIAQGLLELTNLILYRGPVLDSIQYTYQEYPTYLYFFDYRGEYHRFGHLENPLPFEVDATLSDDNIYLFPYPSEVSQLNGEDTTVSKSIVTMWTTFAKYNIPNITPGAWPKVTTPNGPFVRFTKSASNPLELDVHFAEGIERPNLYPAYFTTTTTTTTRRPYRYSNPYAQNAINYRGRFENVLNENRPPQPYDQERPYSRYSQRT